ncbi:hypothetical protein LCGC14_0940360 [marine sediment metagenome]|uniref:Uncharacterized protein n=1 Tax=marine sediment metagenome TaxID=412755 RepID=A0A0F9RRM4_9ZZZZ
MIAVGFIIGMAVGMLMGLMLGANRRKGGGR